MLPLLAAALACGAAAPPACAGTLETRSSLGLSEHVPGTPRDVLYVFDHPAGDCAYLARFDEDGSRRVSVFKLGGAAARAVRLEATPFPAFIRSDDRSVLVRWVRRTSGLPVHNLVEVKERCWPVFTSYTGIDSEPLLELSAVYPGRPSEPVPPVPSVSDETLQKALVTDPGTDADAVQAMLGLLEDARELGTMDLSAFDGSETVAVIQKRAPQAPRDVVTTLLTGSGLEVPTVVEPPELFSNNRLISFDPAAVRGKLPPAVPIAIIRRGNPALKRVALTIDDGWGADMRILDLLKSWRIRFTAFPIGEYLTTPQGREVARRVYEMGGEICSHTWSHRTMRKMPEPTFLNELWRSEQEICGLTHEVYPYVRFSGGDFDVAAVNWASREGFWVVNWTIDTQDTKRGLTTDQRVAYVLANLQPGAIILCHFGGIQTFDVLARTIPEIQKRGYDVTTLSNVLEGTPFRLNR
jgi:peptidoglycan/xylan/chitin deacetylase (PgdA/CDA1 family)